MVRPDDNGLYNKINSLLDLRHCAVSEYRNLVATVVLKAYTEEALRLSVTQARSIATILMKDVIFQHMVDVAYEKRNFKQLGLERTSCFVLLCSVFFSFGNFFFC
jgi:hypothetical protein